MSRGRPIGLIVGVVLGSLTMLAGMLLMALAFWAYAIAMALARVRNLILERERHTEWVHHALEQRA